MLAQLAKALAGLQLPLRLKVGDAPPVDLGPEPRVTLIIRDPTLLPLMAEPSLDLLGEAFIDQRLEVEGPILDVIELADGENDDVENHVFTPNECWAES